jgi:hypothetical protein
MSSGCLAESLDNEPVRLPLYQSCESVLPDYERALSNAGYSVNFATKRFMNSVGVHPGLVGTLEIS